MVKACGEDGDKLVKMWALIAWGTDQKFWEAYGRQTKRTLRDRMDAARELADRGYGKPVQAVEMTGTDGSPLEFRELRESIAGKLAGLASRLGAASVVSQPDGR